MRKVGRKSLDTFHQPDINGVPPHVHEKFINSKMMQTQLISLLLIDRFA